MARRPAAIDARSGQFDCSAARLRASLAIGLWRARTGSQLAHLVVLGAIAYLVYGYAIFAFAVAVNPMTLLHYAILGLATWSLGFALAGRRTDDEAAARLPRRTAGAFLVATAALFALLWLGQIGGSIVSGEPAPALAGLGLPTNPVWALDLAFTLPTFAVAGVLLLRNARGARLIALPLLVFAAVMGLSILAIFAFDGMAGRAVNPVPVALIGAIVIIVTGLNALGTTAGSQHPRASVRQAELPR